MRRVGFFVSPKGPILFCEDQHFPVYDRTYTSEIRKPRPGEIHQFVLLKDGSEVLSVTYEPNPTLYLVPYMEHELDVDFLAWTDYRLKAPDFYTRYPRDGPFEPLPPSVFE